jgi:type VI secretion system protein ImpF
MQRFVPPLLDRLIDAAPLARAEPLRPAMSLEQLKDAVARDVESLLNARRGSTRAALDGYANARASVVAFGLDDFASMSMASTVDRAAICRSIERAITDHDPRLRSVRVDLDQRDAATQKLRFSIHAMLVVHPLHEPVNFDAVLQTTTQNYAVNNARRAI